MDEISMNVARPADRAGGAAINDEQHASGEYEALIPRVAARFLLNVNLDGTTQPVFTTGATGLWQAYLDALPADIRQHYNCDACRRFIERFGGLVTIDSVGRTESAIWDTQDARGIFVQAIEGVIKIVRRANVTGVFLSPETIWGKPQTGEWQHFAVEPPSSLVYKGKTLTAGQAMAVKREDLKNVVLGLTEFSPATLDQALRLLETDSLYRSEKVIGPARWLRQLHTDREAAKGPTATLNVVWRAVATAPDGFCHPRSSMIGTVLEDIVSGMDFDTVSRRFAAKMHPLQYQRPQAAPSAGTIAAAEKIMQQMQAAGSLARRYATIDDIRPIWVSKPAHGPAVQEVGGVFGHLMTKEPKGKAATPISSLAIPPVVMTWEKLRRTVLPTADQIEYYAPVAPANYAVLVTAVNAEAPAILQWDSEEVRNPVSWYVWIGGSLPSQFGLAGGVYHKVSAVTYKPSMWGREEIENDHQGKGVIFVLDGARETRSAGVALFPEMLKSEFHGIRSVLEAYSAGAQIEGTDGPQVCGIMVDKGGRAAGANGWDALLRVTTGGKVIEYRLDRWD